MFTYIGQHHGGRPLHNAEMDGSLSPRKMHEGRAITRMEKMSRDWSQRVLRLLGLKALFFVSEIFFGSKKGGN